MLDAAEALMAERGLGAVSMRDVVTAAGQRNNSAAQYHFGSRDGLIEAIVERRMGPINHRRQQFLDDLDAAGRGHDVRGLVEALVQPLADATVARPGSCYARLLAQSHADPQWRHVVDRSLHSDAYNHWRERLIASLDHVPQALRRSRVDHVVGLVIAALARWEAGHLGGRVAMAARVNDLVDIAVGALDAPVSAATHAALPNPQRTRTPRTRRSPVT